MPDGRTLLHRNVKLLWFLPTGTLIFFLLLAGMMAFLAMPEISFAGITHSNFFFALPLAAAIFCALVYGWEEIIYRNFTYELDESEIIVRQGVFTRMTNVVPYSTIQDITSERSLAERLLGLATLQIETAGSGHLVSETHIPGIANKDALISEIMQRVKQTKGAMGTETRLQGQDSFQILSGILRELQGISSKLGDFQRRIDNAGSAAKEQKSNSKKASLYNGYEQFKKK